MSGPLCGRCGRRVALPGREGTCSNCHSLANSADCAVCGEFRRVAGRNPEGRPWCQRCRKRVRNRQVDEERHRLIIECVIAADPSLTAETAGAALEDTVTTRRSLRRLAEHLEGRADVFAAGPTSVLPVLDRFTRALIAAGAQAIITIDPVCDRCGRQRPRYARTRSDQNGGVCSACWARTHKPSCSTCGHERRVVARDPDGQAVCDLCLRQVRRRERLDELSEQIAAVLADSFGSLNQPRVIATVERTAPTVPTRRLLAQQLRDGPPLTVPARRPGVVARLLADLRAQHVAVPAAVCAECDQPADPLFVHGGVARCYGCERRRDNHHRRGSDTDAAQRIVDAVTAADSSLAEEAVRQVLADVVPSRRALPRLAGYVAAHPDVFIVGPTTTVAVVDRFTRALVAAGAQAIRSIEPVCDRCGKRRPRNARTATGGLCLSCSRKGLCTACGQVGRLASGGDGSQAICRQCAYRRRVAGRLEDLTGRIVIAVIDAQPTIAPCMIVAAVERVAADVVRRGLLVDQLVTGPSLATPARRYPVVARVLAELRANGADIPAATCADCNGPAEPLFIHRAVVRCTRCATHCPDCGHLRSRPAAGRCRWCNIGPPRPACVECGRAPRGGISDDGRCCQCRQRAERHCGDCGKTADSPARAVAGCVTAAS